MSKPKSMNNSVLVLVIRKKGGEVENIWVEGFEGLSSEEAARKYARCLRGIVEIGEVEEIG